MRPNGNTSLLVSPSRPPLQRADKKFQLPKLKAPPARSIKVKVGAQSGFTPRAPLAEPAVISRAESLSEAEESETKTSLQKPAPELLSGPVAQSDKSGDPGLLGIARRLIDQSPSYDDFVYFHDQATLRQKEKILKSGYTSKLTPYADAKGSEQVDHGVQRTAPKVSDRVQKAQVEVGKELYTGLNKVGNVLREKTRHPRTKGSSYLTDTPNNEALTPARQLTNDYFAAGVAGARALNLVPSNIAALEGPSLAYQVAPAADVLSTTAVVSQMTDAVFAAGACLKLISEKEQAKADLNFKDAASRFVDYASGITADCTPEDAAGFVKLLNAGGKLFKPTLEDESTDKAARARLMRSAGSVVPNAVAAGIEIANTFAPVPLANVPLAPFTIALSAVEVEEAKQEFLRRVGQEAQAESCKSRMQAVLHTTPAHHRDYELVEGLVDCFALQQDRSIAQAQSEQKFALTRAGKAGAIGGGTIAGAAAVGAMVGLGVLTAVSGGAAAAVPVAAAAVGGVATAVRNHRRAHVEHKEKWEQRMANVVGLETPREDLESKLSGTAENTRLRSEQEEGDYMPEEDRFAGRHRVMDLEARKNPYVALRVLALQVQDIVQGRKQYDENSPIVQLVHAIGIDPLLLLAIRKAAEPMKPDRQLDFIQSQLALKLHMKFRVGAGGTQTPPHVSVFLRHFRTALSAVRDAYSRGDVASPDLHADIWKALVALYPEPKSGMQAFESAIGVFMEKTKDLPATDFRNLLKEFAEYAARVPADSLQLEVNRKKFDGLIKKDKEHKERKEQRDRQEADDLVRQLEKFRHPASQLLQGQA
jgi:hypothetical protein